MKTERCQFCHELVQAPVEEHTPYCEAYERSRRVQTPLPRRNPTSDPDPDDPTECRRCGRNPYKQGYAGCIYGA